MTEEEVIATFTQSLLGTTTIEDVIAEQNLMVDPVEVEEILLQQNFAQCDDCCQWSYLDNDKCADCKRKAFRFFV